MKKARKIRMVAADLDGTLLRKDKKISDYTDEVIQRLRADGVIFVAATARPVRAVKEFLPWLQYDAGIFHNGAVVYDAGVRVGGVGVKNAGELAGRVLADRPDCHAAVEADDVLYANFDAERIWPGAVYVRTEDFSMLRGHSADKMIFEACSMEELEEFRRYLPEELYIQLSENRIAMVMNRKATKTEGLRLLAARHGFSLRETAAFGDDYNDIEMLRECGTGIAVANALEEVRAAADGVCGSNEEDGVARWLEENLLSGGGGAE
ncbi:MAG: HAD family hydrolase [Lachnospiraceae bacterium]|nr:HAD family hydrolase [Lachnospiraceae bacterium]